MKSDLINAMKKNKLFFVLVSALLIFNIIYIFYQNKQNVSKESDVLFVPTNEKSINLLRMPYASSLKIFNDNFTFMEFVSKTVNYEVKLLVPKSYDDMKRLINSGDADIIWPATSYFVENLSLFENYNIILRPVIHGKDRYRGAFIVKSDSEIKEFKQLESKIFGFTDINSASGYKLPVSHMKKKYDIEPYSFFSDIKFLGSHEEVVLNVFYGKIDAGAVFEDAPESFLGERKNDVRIIDYTDEILYEPILVKKELNDIFNIKIQNSIINKLPDEVRKDLGIDGFVKAELDDYKIIIDLMENY